MKHFNCTIRPPKSSLGIAEKCATNDFIEVNMSRKFVRYRITSYLIWRAIVGADPEAPTLRESNVLSAFTKTMRCLGLIWIV
jgi:hypothetical protein